MYNLTNNCLILMLNLLSYVFESNFNIVILGRESRLPPDHIGRIDMIVAEIREVINHPTYSYNYFVATVNVGKLFSMLIVSTLSCFNILEQSLKHIAIYKQLHTPHFKCIGLI